MSKIPTRTWFKKEKQAVEDQKAIILSEIEDVKSQISLLTKTSAMLEKEFVLCLKQAEQENDISLVSKVNTLKRKRKTLPSWREHYDSWRRRKRNEIDVH